MCGKHALFRIGSILKPLPLFQGSACNTEKKLGVAWNEAMCNLLWYEPVIFLFYFIVYCYQNSLAEVLYSAVVAEPLFVGVPLSIPPLSAFVFLLVGGLLSCVGYLFAGAQLCAFLAAGTSQPVYVVICLCGFTEYEKEI